MAKYDGVYMRKRRQKSIPPEMRGTRCSYTGKLRYTAEDALVAIEHAYERKYEQLSGYKCCHGCGDWHLTSTPLERHIWYRSNVSGEHVRRLMESPMLEG